MLHFGRVDSQIVAALFACQINVSSLNFVENAVQFVSIFFGHADVGWVLCIEVVRLFRERVTQIAKVLKF